MQRSITRELYRWKTDPSRKPLILKGARQVGKTYAVKDFAANYYTNLAYFNFDQDARLAEYLASTKDPARIVDRLSFLLSEKITPGETLIFFDEIQECPDALNALKYFAEEAPEYHVIAAGSLLGVRMAHTSFPVGKVDFLELLPMSFAEFLEADNTANILDFVKEMDEIEQIPEAIASRLDEKFRAYLIVGGMPEAVSAWVEERDIVKVQRIHEAILESYERDFSKHTTEAEANKISQIWDSLPSQLARPNKKFIYQAVREGARAREYESALNWLKNAGLIEKVPCVSKPAYPLKPYEELSDFKIYAFDTGLLCHKAGIDSSTAVDGDKIFNEFGGAVAENFALQAMRASGAKHIFYYVFDRYEIDFLLQYGNAVYPVEVKSGTSTSHRSLTLYNEKFSPEVALRFSMNNLDFGGNILNIPLYLAEQYGEFLDMAKRRLPLHKDA